LKRKCRQFVFSLAIARLIPEKIFYRIFLEEFGGQNLARSVGQLRAYCIAETLAGGVWTSDNAASRAPCVRSFAGISYMYKPHP
jgi:hypothetical protein